VVVGAQGLLATARAWLRTEWVPATQATLAMVLPLGLAVSAGDLRAGLAMSLGAFAALYARREPYRRRAVLVAAVGLGLIASVALGTLAQGSPWTAGAAIAVVAAVATWATQSVGLGPPGAYMFTLVAAVATNLPPEAGSLAARVGYVALGAAGAWVITMAGALVRPAVPQRIAVAEAFDALAGFLRAPAQAAGPARHAAAVRLRVAGDQLVAAGPQSRDAHRLRHLHGHVRRAFLLAAGLAETPCAGHADAAARIAAALRTGRPAPVVELTDDLGRELAAAVAALGSDVESPAGEHFTASSRWHLGPHSLAVPAAIRVFVAAIAAAALASAVQLPRAYWAPAAAVVVLQATSARLTLRRAVHRVAGTLAGVVLAAGVFSLHPSPVGVVVAVGVLQFAVEVCIARVYALGVTFLTPLALLIAESGRLRMPLDALLSDRLAETVLGCAVGIVVALTVLPRAATGRVPGAITRARRSERELHWLLDLGDAAGARRARRDLVRALTSLAEAIRNAKGELLPARYRRNALLVEAAEVEDAGWLAVTRTLS
jgi:uncharacterized membrane protein YccC